eukprot:CAMPEP_0206464884 /NCGR_PEP_ID=MMETSP0324_2-20121206/27484_1 /ASSEMBLY_ACC=CAM_ASM_000836 /TAXON_ID=2866 /ORGANISM="Crypthecodinium cohnii, Strain Seligo" /LENGTH=825 /DNA_ID=CAMNT_0053937605 /DNA_START=85 /DNA_END=2562 /DNA_ORIENTATION=-
MTVDPSVKPENFGDYAELNMSVVILFVVVATLVISVYLLDTHWRRTQIKLEKVTGMMNESRAFSMNLVRHFMPSFKVAKYQFRGMQPKASTVSVEFEDLGLELKSGKRVLNGVTGQFGASRMCAIMGPSGGGKTTFMNVLCGKATYGKMVGKMMINGKVTDPKNMRGFMGFVPQDDIVHEDLTVREQIQFSVRLRGDVRHTPSRIELITEDVLNVMQIDHIQNSIVGSVENRGISGGQRKRVNIGWELAAEPTLLFLDEPTSGLDSTSSLAVCLSLRKMCQLGMTSIMVIHQPRYSLFTLFDDVLLLGKGGQTVYLGPSLGAKAYFEHCGFEMPKDENPADWFMDVLSGEVATTRVKNFKPDMLFGWWKELHDAAKGDHAALSRQFTSNGLRARVVTHEEDRSVLCQKLEEGWDSVDENHDGSMDATELGHLLGHCAAGEPSEEVVHELLQRMAGDGAQAVTRAQFLDYLVGLADDVAHDEGLKALDEAGHGPSTRFHTESAKKIVEHIASLEHEVGAKMPCHCFGAPAAKGEDNDNGVVSAPRPNFFGQFRIFLLRRIVKWGRMHMQRALFLGALSLGGIILAILDGPITDSPRWDSMTYLNLHTCLALLLSIFCLSVFGNDQPVFWRESASGICIPAYFFAKVLVNTVDIVIQTFLFTAVYYVVRQPWIPFWEFIIPFAWTSFVASGWGYLVSTLVPPRHGPFFVSLVSFVVCGLLGNPTTMANYTGMTFMEVAVSIISITRWTNQMSFIIAYKHLNPTPEDPSEAAKLVLYKGVFYADDSDLDHPYSDPEFTHACLALSAMGVVLLVASFLGLKYRNRAKQV